MLTDQENNPIPTNGEHPEHDYFGTTIFNGDNYYILPDETIVDVVNVDKYFVNILKAELVKANRD